MNPRKTQVNEVKEGKLEVQTPGKSIREMEQAIAEMERQVEVMRSTAERERAEEAERVRAEAEKPKLTTSQAVTIFTDKAFAVRAAPRQEPSAIEEEARPYVAESRRLLKVATELRDAHIEEFSAVVNSDEQALLVYKVNPKTVSNLFRVARDAHGLLGSTIHMLSEVPRQARAIPGHPNPRAALNDIKLAVTRARELPEAIAGALKSVRIMSSELAERIAALDPPAVTMVSIITSEPRNPNAEAVVERDPETWRL